MTKHQITCIKNSFSHQHQIIITYLQKENLSKCINLVTHTGIIIFFRCDGSVISAPSTWEGEKTPNINGEERFLRGGLDGVQLETEEDSLQAHTHEVSDSGHNHGYDDKYSSYDNGVNGILGPRGGDRSGDRFDQSHSSTTNGAYSNIKVTDVSGARTSGETRPKNIRVVYIMKVF